MKILIFTMIIFAAISVLSTMMALINFDWLTALVSAVLSVALLTGIDSLAPYIDAR